MKNESANDPEMKRPVTLRVRNPSGMVAGILAHAKRLDDLNGKTIGELSNGMWEDRRTFPVIREALRKRFPDLKIIPYTEFPVGSEQIEQEGVVEQLLQSGCQAVIVGNAA